MKSIRDLIKVLVFFYVTLVKRKVQKVESVNIQSDCKTTSKKRTDASVGLQAVEKNETVKSVNTQNNYETTHKKWTDKNKTNLFCVL